MHFVLSVCEQPTVRSSVRQVWFHFLFFFFRFRLRRWGIVILVKSKIFFHRKIRNNSIVRCKKCCNMFANATIWMDGFFVPPMRIYSYLVWQPMMWWRRRKNAKIMILTLIFVWTDICESVFFDYYYVSSSEFDERIRVVRSKSDSRLHLWNMAHCVWKLQSIHTRDDARLHFVLAFLAFLRFHSIPFAFTCDETTHMAFE